MLANRILQSFDHHLLFSLQFVQILPPLFSLAANRFKRLVPLVCSQLLSKLFVQILVLSRNYVLLPDILCVLVVLRQSKLLFEDPVFTPPLFFCSELLNFRFILYELIVASLQNTVLLTL